MSLKKLKQVPAGLKMSSKPKKNVPQQLSKPKPSNFLAKKLGKREI